VTPEKIVKSKTLLNKLEKAHAGGRLDRIVIDEVHCCSQWGHDFRLDYSKLGMIGGEAALVLILTAMLAGVLKTQFATVPILAVTATATARVAEDVKRILRIPNCISIKGHFNRCELSQQTFRRAQSFFSADRTCSLRSGPSLRQRTRC
jgi:ATP-dependent DNA helicase Q1